MTNKPRNTLVNSHTPATQEKYMGEGETKRYKGRIAINTAPSLEDISDLRTAYCSSGRACEITVKLDLEKIQLREKLLKSNRNK